ERRYVCHGGDCETDDGGLQETAARRGGSVHRARLEAARRVCHLPPARPVTEFDSVPFAPIGAGASRRDSAMLRAWRKRGLCTFATAAAAGNRSGKGSAPTAAPGTAWSRA